MSTPTINAQKFVNALREAAKRYGDQANQLYIEQRLEEAKFTGTKASVYQEILTMVEMSLEWPATPWPSEPGR